MVDNYAGGCGARLYDDPDIKLFILVGWDQNFFVCCLAHRGSTGVFHWSGISIVGQITESVESSFLIHQFGYHDLFVCP